MTAFAHAPARRRRQQAADLPRQGSEEDTGLETVLRRLQRSHGNAGVQRLIEASPTAEAMLLRQETTEAPAATVAPPEPYSVVTDYGEFLVYPNDFIGPLPVADPTIGPWAVREAEFGFIEIAMESVRGGSAGIVINGTNGFKSAVMLDLAWLLTSGVGQELVSEIVASGKTLTIEEAGGGNETSYSPDAASYENADGSPGVGADVHIGYNTKEWNPYGGDKAWMRRPPGIGLAHEMVHAWTGMTGTRALGETGGVRRRELQATGLGEFSGSRLSENRFRAAFGLPLRPEY